MSSSSDSIRAWLPVAPVADNRVPLLCLPFAGGGTAPYHPWRTSSFFQVSAFMLPGRERRIVEPPVSSWRELVSRLADVTQAVCTTTYVLFGHSFGAIVAYELARELRARGGSMPAHLFVSGRQAPHERPAKPRPGGRSDADLIQHLRELSGTPPEVLANGEILRLLLPAFRADLSLDDDYEPAAEPPLAIPMSALGGTDDVDVERDSLEAWRRYTSEDFEMTLFPGDHFFPFNGLGAQEVLRYMAHRALRSSPDMWRDGTEHQRMGGQP